GLERLVPGEAEVLAVDLGLGREAEDVLAPRVGGGAAELDVEGDLLGHVPDGEVTDDLELVAGVLGDPLAPEGDLRELVGREEVVAPEVSVAVGDPGVDARGLDDGLDAGLERVLGDDDLALELAEVPADLAHHHVPDDEADPGVGLIEHEVAGRGDLETFPLPNAHSHPPNVLAGNSSRTTFYRRNIPHVKYLRVH